MSMLIPLLTGLNCIPRRAFQDDWDQLPKVRVLITGAKCLLYQSFVWESMFNRILHNFQHVFHGDTFKPSSVLLENRFGENLFENWCNALGCTWDTP